VIPDEPPWVRDSRESIRSGGYQSVPTIPTSSTSSSSQPASNRGTTDKQPPKKPNKRIVAAESSKIHHDPLPEGCVDLFVAESESSEESEAGEEEGNVWRKMKGRLKSDINDLTNNGAHLQ